MPSATEDPLTYPGRIPASAYVLHRSQVHVAEAADFLGLVRDLETDLADRVAVVASGSNAAPARLAEKCGANASIPVARVEVVDTAVVYSAHISRYGSIPAMRIEHRGSRSRMHIPMLDPEQLDQVDATEGSYERVVLDGRFPGFLGPVHAYESWRGPMTVEGRPIRVEEVPAVSPLAALGQSRALDLVATLTGAAVDGRRLSKMVASHDVDAEDVNRLLRS